MAPQHLSISLDRMSGLLTWWGVPDWMGNNTVETQMKRFQAVASDLQKSYGDACGRQMDVLLAANERLAHSLQQVCRSRHPQDIVAAESNILAIFLDGIERQAQIWMDLTQRVVEHCAALASEPADERHTPAREERETTTAAPPGPLPTEAVSGHQVTESRLASDAVPPSPALPEQSDHGMAPASHRPSARRALNEAASTSSVVGASPGLDLAPGEAQAADKPVAATTVPGADGVASDAGGDSEAKPARAEPASVAEPGASGGLVPAGGAGEAGDPDPEPGQIFGKVTKKRPSASSAATRKARNSATP